MSDPADALRRDPRNSPEMARVAAGPLSQESFLAAERLFAGGLSFDEAKRRALEERIPGIIADHGEAVADLTIQMVMNVPESGVHPLARRRHRDRRWAALVAPLVEAGRPPPSRLDRKLWEWFGRVPPALRR